MWGRLLVVAAVFVGFVPFVVAVVVLVAMVLLRVLVGVAMAALVVMLVVVLVGVAMAALVRGVCHGGDVRGGCVRSHGGVDVGGVCSVLSWGLGLAPFDVSCRG